MKKYLTFITAAALILSAGCTPLASSDGQNISETTVNNETVQPESEISDSEISAVKSGKTVSISDSNACLKIMEEALDGNPTTLNTVLSDEYIANAEKNSTVIKAEYGNGKDLSVAENNDPIKVDKIYFILSDSENLIAVYSGSNTTVMEIPSDIIDEINNYIA